MSNFAVKVISQDTKHEMVAYVRGYLLALNDILHDAQTFSEIEPLLEKIRESRKEAMDTLRALGEFQ